MFCGEYQHNFDQKGRVIMPARFREGLQDKFMATRGTDGCIYAFSLEEFEKRVTKLLSTEEDYEDKEVARQRHFLGSARECEFDSQGRAMIPSNLREWAKIKKQVTIIGIGTRIEIWDFDNYEAYKNKEESQPSHFNKKQDEVKP